MGKIRQYNGKLFAKDTRKGFKYRFQPDGFKKDWPVAEIDPNTKLSTTKCKMFKDDDQVIGLATEQDILIWGVIPEYVYEIVSPIPDSFLASKTLLPTSSKSTLKKFRSPDNFFLKFHKAARWDDSPSESQENGEKFQFIKPGLNELQYLLKPDFGHINFGKIAERNEFTALSLFSGAEEDLVQLQADPEWRWIVGLGHPSVYENGMALHHVYGIPYIPGSAVKGMLRTWIINECFGYHEEAEDEALSNPVFSHIFGHGNREGSEGQIGKVTFFDAFPTQPVRVEPDIINNHFPKYYQGSSPPADWQLPIPVFFMSCREGRLEFIIGVRENRALGEDGIPFFSDRFSHVNETSMISDLLDAWLSDGLEHHGIGAKTSVGYGRMVRVS